jgi:hypothetical protein
MRSRPALSSPGIWPKTVVALDHAVLHLDGAANGFDHAAEFDDAPVAGALHHAPVMHSNGRVDQIATERSQAGKRSLLIDTREAAMPTTSAAKIAASLRFSVMEG